MEVIRNLVVVREIIDTAFHNVDANRENSVLSPLGSVIPQPGVLHAQRINVALPLGEGLRICSVSNPEYSQLKHVYGKHPESNCKSCRCDAEIPESERFCLIQTVLVGCARHVPGKISHEN